MRIAASVLTAAGIWFLPPGAIHLLYAANPQAPSVTATAPIPSSAPHRAVLDRYCVTCHNDRLQTADLALDTLDLEHVGQAPGGLGKGRAEAAGRCHAPGGKAAAGPTSL